MEGHNNLVQVVSHTTFFKDQKTILLCVESTIMSYFFFMNIGKLYHLEN